MRVLVAPDQPQPPERLPCPGHDAWAAALVGFYGAALNLLPLQLRGLIAMITHLVLGMVYWTLLPVALLADLFLEQLLATDMRRWAALPLALALSISFTLVASFLLHWAVAVAVAGAEVCGIDMSTLPIFEFHIVLNSSPVHLCLAVLKAAFALILASVLIICRAAALAIWLIHFTPLFLTTSTIVAVAVLLGRSALLGSRGL